MKYPGTITMKKQLLLRVKQIQDLKTTNIFKMPITLLIDNGKLKEHTIWVQDKKTVFDIPCNSRPKMVVFNTGMKVPCKLKMDKSVADLKYQLINSLILSIGYGQLMNFQRKKEEK